MAFEWGKDWKQAKKFFETETGKRKPDAKVEGIFNRHQSGIDSSITKIEKAWVAADRSKASKDVAEYRKLVVAFKTVKDNYIKVLDTTVEKEIRDRETKTTYSKACKYLGKQLNAIHGSMESQVGWLDSASKQESVMTATANNAINSIQGAIAKVAAATAKVKTKPEPAFFRKEIYTPARDLSQFIGNIALLRKKGATFPPKVTDQAAKAIYDVVRPYGDERIQTTMPDGTSTDVVLLELKKLTNAAKAAAELIKP